MNPERVVLTTSDGVELEAEACPPGEDAGAKDEAVWVTPAHPHPLRGGSMHAGIIDVLFRELPGRGIGVLRWNFRGVEGSTGTHGDGDTERLDVLAAIERTSGVTTGPIISAGWSFGADVASAVDHDRIAAWLLIAPPMHFARPPLPAAGSDRPTVALIPEHDQFNPPAKASPSLAAWSDTTISIIPQTDHFLGGASSHVLAALTALVSSLS